MEISQQKICLVGAIICHKKAGDDACAHLECIKKTGKCLHEAGVRLHHLPDNVVNAELRPSYLRGDSQRGAAELTIARRK